MLVQLIMHSLVNSNYAAQSHVDWDAQKGGALEDFATGYFDCHSNNDISFFKMKVSFL